jgi:hypothetical protein
MAKVRIKGLVTTSQYGTLTDGAILTTDAAFAAHLVDECNAAEYCEDSPPVSELTDSKEPSEKRGKRK